MKIPVKRLLIKTLKITGISIGSILALLFLLPILFPGTIAEQVKNFTNKNLDGEMNFSKVRLSFFKHFPSLTVSLYDFSLKGSAPFKQDTLVAANEIAFGINLKKLIFDKKININKIFIADANFNVQVNEKGEANYNVYVGDKNKKATADADTASTSLKLKKIIIENSHFVYNDKSVDILIDAKGFNYQGNGDLNESVFDLYSHAQIDSFNLVFAKEAYLTNKKVDGDLITKINTNSLAFVFQKNKLLINKLPVQFNGKFDFLKNGYELDFTASSINSSLYDVVTALPPQYLTWQDKATIKGDADLLLTLKGQYIASSNTKPDLAFDMKIRDGYIAYQKAPFPASNLFLNLQTKMLGINADSLELKIDSVYFNIDKDYFSAVINTKGLNNPHVNANINAQMDLENLDKAFGFGLVDVKGKCSLHFKANGNYVTGPNPNSLRHESTLLGIPSFQLQSSVKDGYFKYTSLPIAVSSINFTANSSCPGSDYKATNFSIKNLTATALNNFIKGDLSISSIKEMAMDANLQSSINLGDIEKIYPVQDIALKGLLKFNINAKGKFEPAQKLFPVTTADLSLQNGSIKTSYYPDPITNIEVKANATNNGGSLKDLKVAIQPASLQFEGKPFTMQATLQDFTDIAYNVKAKGELDIAKIYKVFSRKGLDVSGFIKADLSLQGKQSDAINKRYSNLHNEGTLEVKDIKTVSEYFPQPFFIKEGLFRFNQEKMWFNKFIAQYGRSDFSMEGYLQNVISYALSSNEKLKGNFTVTSNFTDVDEFMAFAPAASDSAAKKNVQDTVSKAETGVIIIPSNLDLTLIASIKKASYNSMVLENLKGNISIADAKLVMKQTGFQLIGAQVLMDAIYGSTAPNKAFFDYHISAKDFDVAKAYNEIKIFHDMATAASKAQGVISLDYTLKGILDGTMHPIYPSLEGGGTLSLQQVKVMGLKMFGAIGKKTGKDSIANPNISKVDVKSVIKNNLITIERFKIKMAGFRLRMEGQTSFDGGLNLKVRLGLPPLGIIGIPMRISGTQENPSIKIGKSDTDPLEEKEYKEELPAQK